MAYGETVVDQYGRQLCPGGTIFSQPECKAGTSVLTLEGAWSYNLEIVPGSYHFRCPKCRLGFVGNTEETALHLAGIKAAKAADKLAEHLQSVKQRVISDIGTAGVLKGKS